MSSDGIKKFSRFKARPGFLWANGNPLFPLVAWLLGCLILLPVGCRTAPMAPLNLSQPGWKLREGQAVWRSGQRAPEIAGELQLAIHADGRVWLQFTKTPIPFVVAQSSPTHWQIQFVPQNRSFSGPGKPPVRLAWLQLARAISGATAAPVWSWQAKPDGSWRLENPSSGEMIAGYLAP